MEGTDPSDFDFEKHETKDLVTESPVVTESPTSEQPEISEHLDLDDFALFDEFGMFDEFGLFNDLDLIEPTVGSAEISETDSVEVQNILTFEDSELSEDSEASEDPEVSEFVDEFDATAPEPENTAQITLNPESDILDSAELSSADPPSEHPASSRNVISAEPTFASFNPADPWWEEPGSAEIPAGLLALRRSLPATLYVLLDSVQHRHYCRRMPKTEDCGLLCFVSSELAFTFISARGLSGIYDQIWPVSLELAHEIAREQYSAVNCLIFLDGAAKKNIHYVQ